MNKKFHWSKEYCSYSYLDVKGRFLVSLRRCEEYEWTEGIILNLSSDSPYTPIFEETCHGNTHYTDAKKILEKQAENLHLI